MIGFFIAAAICLVIITSLAIIDYNKNENINWDDIHRL